MYLVLEVININCKTTAFITTFAARIVNVWNSLPDYVVDVNSLKQFETRLDKFWGNQDANVMFDWSHWTAEITVTGDRSEFKLETFSACQTPRSIFCPSMFNSFLVIRTASTKNRRFHAAHVFVSPGQLRSCVNVKNVA